MEINVSVLFKSNAKVCEQDRRTADDGEVNGAALCCLNCL